MRIGQEFALVCLALSTLAGVAFGQSCGVTLSPASSVLTVVPGQVATVNLTSTLSGISGPPNGPYPVECNALWLNGPVPGLPLSGVVTPQCNGCGAQLGCPSSNIVFSTAGLWAAGFTFLGPGSYDFQVIACFNFGLQPCFPFPSLVPATITVNVLPVGPLPPAPTLVGMTPHSGGLIGGARTTIAGFNLSTTTSVSFGGNLATNLVVINNQTLQCTAPPRSVLGPVNVVVATAGGTASLNADYTYVPHVFSISPPTAAPTSAPFVLTLLGSGFGPSSVVYGNGEALPTTWAPPFNLLATVPPSVFSSAFALTVEVADVVTAGRASAPVIVPFGAYANAGKVVASPLDTPPGELVDLRVTSVKPLAPLALVFAPSPALYAPFPDAILNFALEVVSPELIFLVDGIGLSSAPPAAADDLGAYEAIVLFPAPPVGYSGKLQAIYLDSTAPGGFRMTWAYPVDF